MTRFLIVVVKSMFEKVRFKKFLKTMEIGCNPELLKQSNPESERALQQKALLCISFQVGARLVESG